MLGGGLLLSGGQPGSVSALPVEIERGLDMENHDGTAKDAPTPKTSLVDDALDRTSSGDGGSDDGRRRDAAVSRSSTSHSDGRDGEPAASSSDSGGATSFCDSGLSSSSLD